MDEYKCNKCGAKENYFTVKILWNNNGDDFGPKTTLMVKVSCVKCGVYIKFASQTQELIEILSEQLSEVKLCLSSTKNNPEQLSLAATKGGNDVQ